MDAPYRKIACCIDNDQALGAVVSEALRLRALGPGELQVLHVAPNPSMLLAGPYGYMVPPDDLFEQAHRWLDDAAARIPGGEPVLLDGYAPRAVCRHADAAGVDLIVAAAHRGAFRRALLGSFASYLGYHAHCPVLIVHPPVEEKQSAAGREAGGEGAGS